MVGISVNLSGIRKKISVEANIRGQQALANQAMADMNQFVPMKEGNLRIATSIERDGSAVHYQMPYAKAQFYGSSGKAVFRKYSTPGTGKRWDLRATGMYLPAWKRAYLKGAGIN
ncbi:minor capsid protein [Enterococcus sp. AZ103]|uniref:minor capsid protein n=1 Tax=Enterococcus sp. AZ103 TaxID=2774628 RepID=UPI003F1F9FE7